MFTNSFITYMFCVKMVKAVSEESMPSVGEDRANVPSKNILKKLKQYDSTGDRTQNLWFRRPAPYPLGHGVLMYNM